MRFQIASDLHLEHRTKTNSLFDLIDRTNADALVLCGDICPYGSRLLSVIEEACHSYPYVIFVLGNHEFVGGITHHEVINRIRCFEEHMSEHGFLFLENQMKTINGINIFGGTMYSNINPESMVAVAENIHDFKDENWTVDQHVNAFEEWKRAFLEQKEKIDVCITHFIPSYQSSKKYVGDPSESYFTTEMGNEIAYGDISLWIHGHGHDSQDYYIGNTRVVANPLGYPFEKNAFNRGMVVDVTMDRNIECGLDCA